MSKFDVIRAWRDEDYRAQLSEGERASVPQHPAGAIELSESGLRNIQGGYELPETVHPMQCTEATRNCPSICQVFSC